MHRFPKAPLRVTGRHRRLVSELRRHILMYVNLNLGHTSRSSCVRYLCRLTIPAVVQYIFKTDIRHCGYYRALLLMDRY